MKKKLIISFLVLIGYTYSFWSMESMYCDPFPANSETKVTKIVDKSLIDWDRTNLCFLYDKNTSNQIIFYINHSNDFNPHVAKTWDSLCLQKQHVFNVLNCDFTYDKNFWEQENLLPLNQSENNIYPLTYKKQKLLLQEDGSIEKKPSNNIDSLYKNINIDRTLLRFCNTPIVFKQTFSSLSGVKIENTEKGVILSKNDKQIDLTTALRKYFDKDFIEREFSKTVSGAARDSAKFLEPLLYQLNNPSLTKVDFERLKTSEILALWCLIPEEVEAKDLGTGKDKMKKVERQMLGLAKDKDGRLFHWTTDLGKDIAVLIQYGFKNIK